MGRIIGWLFVGGTLALATIDGALIAIVVAGGVAVYAYSQTNKALTGPSDTIFDMEEQKYRRLMLRTTDKELIKQYRDAIKQLRERKETDQAGSKIAAVGMALATFNMPVMALGVIAYNINKRQQDDLEKERPGVRPSVVLQPVVQPDDGLPMVYPTGIVRDNDAVILQRPT